MPRTVIHACPPLINLGAAASLEVKPVVVRSIWFESATFDHATHRAMECAACHAAPRNRRTSPTPDAGRRALRELPCPGDDQDGSRWVGPACRASSATDTTTASIPPQGSARRRAGSAEMTLDQFLNGGPPRAMRRPPARGEVNRPGRADRALLGAG